MVALLKNRKIRTKLLFALFPLAAMVIVAALYSSLESRRIDTWYSNLIDKDIKALQSMTAARALTMRFGMYLYKGIAEVDPDRRQSIDGDLDKAYADYQAVIAGALRESPNRAKAITEAAALFDKSVSDARPVRAAVLANNNEKAMKLMRAGVDAELQQARQSEVDLVKELQASVNQQSSDLTGKTHRAILITWLVVGLGLAASFAAAFYIVQTEVVRDLLSVRGSIQEIASGRLDQRIPCLVHTNEIGEISRALNTLQHVAREREVQHWVKAEVSATLEQLQSAQDAAGFATTLLSRMSECIPLLYGALYVADESRTRFTRVGAFAIDDAGRPREFALGEGLVGQAAIERRLLAVTAGDKIRISAGMGTVTPGSILFVPVVHQNAVTAPGCTAAVLSPERRDMGRQHQDQKASRTDPGAS
jgi:two-component system sensor histidine kinase/response regulator